jgi:hypothetical protein
MICGMPGTTCGGDAGAGVPYAGNGSGDVASAGSSVGICVIAPVPPAGGEGAMVDEALGAGTGVENGNGVPSGAGVTIGAGVVTGGNVA